LELEGNNLNIHTTFNSKDELLRFITSANQFLPALFSFRFQTYIWISDFRIVYEKGLYYFFVSQIRLPITATTEDVAIGHIKQSIQQWLLTQSGEERIIYSFYYYRQALRLSKLEPAAQTLLPEVILNLAKSLEMIFSDKRDRFRRLANEAGLDSDFVESKLIPILILRSKLGIAHVSTSPLTLAQKDNIYTFMVKAFNNVQYALNYISEKVKNNEYVLEPISTELDREEINIIESIQRYLELPDQHPL
jgi:hypothetical protein